jgi:HK97 family phage portal protein
MMLDPQAPPVMDRGLPVLQPSAWSGYPAEWSTAFDSYGLRMGNLVDTAWDAIDLNTRVLASMPAYRVRAGTALPPVSWMIMPAQGMYASWSEFIKEVFWHFHLGETFILSLARNAQNYPAAIAVVPPWLVKHERGHGYSIDGYDLTDPEDLLHIRYARSGHGWRGVGPLEQAGARVTAAKLQERYQADYLQSGGIPHYAIETDRPLNPTQIDAAKVEFAASRAGAGPSDPAVLGGGMHLNAVQQAPIRDVMLLELQQFNEARIAVKLGVHPYMLGLPANDPMTYKSVEMLFDFHHRSCLRPMAAAVMTALSNWALPAGQSIELNADEYTRPPLDQRAAAYQVLVTLGVLSVDEVRAMERFGADDNADISAVTALTGGDQ